MNASNIPKYICAKTRHTGDIDNSCYITALFFPMVILQDGAKGLEERGGWRKQVLFFDLKKQNKKKCNRLALQAHTVGQEIKLS